MPTSRPEYHLATVIVALALVSLAPVPVSADDCPTTTLDIPGVPPEEFPGPSASGTRVEGGGAASFYFHEFGDTSQLIYSYAGIASLTVRGRYRFLGPPSGTVVSGHVGVRMTGTHYGAGGDAYCYMSRATGVLYQDGAAVASSTWYSQLNGPPYYEGCSVSFLGEYTVDCVHPAGTAFDLVPYLYVNNAAWIGHSRIAIKLTFGYMPPGTFLVRCDGDTTAQVVGVEPEISTGLRIASVWPNPSRGEFRANLSVPEGGPAFVRLLDIHGRVVESRVWDASRAASRELTFGSQLAPGFYFLQVSQGATSVVRAVTIRR